MTPYLSACFGAFRREFRSPGALLFVMAFYACILVAWGAVWWSATRAAGGSIKGYSFHNMFWYMATTEASVIVASARRIETIGEEIAGGLVEVEMLRPVSVVGMRIATEFGGALARLCCIGSMGALLAVLYTHTAPKPSAALLAVPAVVLAAACNTVGIHAFAALAFWLRDAKAAWFLYQKCIFLLGGMLIPLQLTPHAFQIVAKALPFWAMAYGAGRLGAGFFEPAILIGQVFWLVVLTLVTLFIFDRGERRVQRGVV